MKMKDKNAVQKALKQQHKEGLKAIKEREKNKVLKSTLEKRPT